MPKSMKISLPLAIAALMLASPWASAVDRPNNQPPDMNSPLTKCQMGCKDRKDGESYEACMLKCKDTHKKNTLSTQPQPKNNPMRDAR